MDQSGLDALLGLELPQLESLLAGYEARNDRANASAIRTTISRKGERQTAEMESSGRIYAHRHVDQITGRVTHTFTGDPSAWMSAYQSGGAVCRVDPSNFRGANSPQAKAAAAAAAQ